MENSSSTIITSLSSNNFSGDLVLMVYFTVTVIVIERIIYLWNPLKKYKTRKEKIEELKNLSATEVFNNYIDS